MTSDNLHQGTITGSDVVVTSMTNVSVSANISEGKSDSEGYFEDVFPSRMSGMTPSFPKVRTVLVSRGIDFISFSVDFKKLKNQLSLFKINSNGTK